MCIPRHPHHQHRQWRTPGGKRKKPIIDLFLQLRLPSRHRRLPLQHHL
ncbi:unnamed protein product [Echinostoma caproni]|uniref:Uncharacterized protein n=1 Tax=Echinostoma caproni TaxID=27848 RepID=A0A3P8GZW7_9TREM|nr:unnamed protein product [Echinostoma caproni]